MLKLNEIAAILEYEAGRYPEESGHDDLKLVFKFGPLTVRCLPTRPAVLAVARKFEWGFPSPSELHTCTKWRTNNSTSGGFDWREFTAPKPRLPKTAVFSKAAYQSFLDSGEDENAREYAILAGWVK